MLISVPLRHTERKEYGLILYCELRTTKIAMTFWASFKRIYKFDVFQIYNLLHLFLMQLNIIQKQQ